MIVLEECIDADRGYLFHSDRRSVEDTSIGELFRAMRREHGRCVSKVFLDRPDGSAQHIGWVFNKRERYEDTGEPYLRETWVSVLERPDERIRHYADLGKRSRSTVRE